MKHYLHPELATRQVRVVLVGAGGTGSQMLEQLGRLNRAMLALGHPKGLQVLVVDHDTVSAANVGRQAFYPCDVGSYKALTLVNRLNMAYGTQWGAEVGKLQVRSHNLGNADVVVGAVDNRAARLAILRCLEHTSGGIRYYLDMGNRAADGQVVLGEVTSDKRRTDNPWRLPHVGELFPELIQAKLDKEEDDLPSCSLAEALEKQSLFINSAVSMFASNLLWQLFTKGEIEYHGAFVNLDHMRVMPIGIDHETWERFGVIKTGKRQKVKVPA